VYGGADVALALRREFGEVSSAPVAPDWRDAWRAFHRAVTIGPWWIGPPWETPPSSGAHPIVIDPGQAFGTGAHPTTRLCLELLLTQAPTSVVDLGSGSGVLAIAAGAIGFEPIAAIDHDAAAVEATLRNARINGVALDARSADARLDPLPAAELGLANLELALIPPVLKRFGGSRLIASGYLVGDEIEVAGWRSIDRRESSGWAADLFGRT
jgi:ribosomal protein L11 methyltransferase